MADTSAMDAHWWAERANLLNAEDDPVAAATIATAYATLALAEQTRIGNLIAYEALRIERTNAGGNYYGPSVVWGNPPTEHGSSPLYDDIAVGLGVPRG